MESKFYPLQQIRSNRSSDNEHKSNYHHKCACKKKWKKIRGEKENLAEAVICAATIDSAEARETPQRMQLYHLPLPWISCITRDVNEYSYVYVEREYRVYGQSIRNLERESRVEKPWCDFFIFVLGFIIRFQIWGFSVMIEDCLLRPRPHLYGLF